MMVTIPIKTRLGADGVLNLRVPTGLAQGEVEVVIVVQTIAGPAKAWPEDFFDETYGAFADHPIERGSQGLFDGREALR